MMEKKLKINKDILKNKKNISAPGVSMRSESESITEPVGERFVSITRTCDRPVPV